MLECHRLFCHHAQLWVVSVISAAGVRVCTIGSGPGPVLILHAKITGICICFIIGVLCIFRETLINACLARLFHDVLSAGSIDFALLLLLSISHVIGAIVWRAWTVLKALVYYTDSICCTNLYFTFYWYCYMWSKTVSVSNTAIHIWYEYFICGL